MEPELEPEVRACQRSQQSRWLHPRHAHDLGGLMQQAQRMRKSSCAPMPTCRAKRRGQLGRGHGNGGHLRGTWAGCAAHRPQVIDPKIWDAAGPRRRRRQSRPPQSARSQGTRCAAKALDLGIPPGVLWAAIGTGGHALYRSHPRDSSASSRDCPASVRRPRRGSPNILRSPAPQARELAQALIEVKEKITSARSAPDLTGQDPCALCAVPAAMVAWSAWWRIRRYLLAIERTSTFRGRYRLARGCCRRSMA